MTVVVGGGPVVVVALLLGVVTSISEALGASASYFSNIPTSCCCTPWKVADDGLRSWVPSTPRAAVALAVNQHVEYLYTAVSPSLCPSIDKIK